MFTLAYTGMNDKQHALDWIKKAAEEHGSIPTTLKVDPVYEPLRDHQHFQELIAQVSLKG